MTIYEYLDLSKENLEKIDINRSYVSYQIKKSDGKRTRRIDAPVLTLKLIQKTIVTKFLYLFKAHPIAHGFVKSRSPRTNAQQHLGKKYLIKIDIKDFFPSITEVWVIHLIEWLCNKQTIFDVPTKDDNILLARLLCLNGKLPQGAPSSPAITNLICYSLDNQLDNLQKLYNCTITRYADDITASFNDKTISTQLIGDVRRAIYRSGFKENVAKFKFCANYMRQKITGVIVNSKLNVPKESWRTLRAELHTAQNGNISEKRLQQLRGKVEWLRSLNPLRGKKYLQKLELIGAKMLLTIF
jgi:hypothetical protein